MNITEIILEALSVEITGRCCENSALLIFVMFVLVLHSVCLIAISLKNLSFSATCFVCIIIDPRVN